MSKLLRYDVDRTILDREDGTLHYQFRKPADHTIIDPMTILQITKHFFDLFKAAKIPTHFVSIKPLARDLIIRKTTPAVLDGLYFIQHFRVTSSLAFRYPRFFEEGAPVDLIENALKEGSYISVNYIDIGIPIAANLIAGTEAETISELFNKACEVVREDLLSHGLDLWCIRMEIGKYTAGSGETVWAITDICSENMHVFDHDNRGISLIELAQTLSDPR